MINFYKKHKFGILLLFSASAAVFLLHITGTGCLIRRIFHIKCLSCGLTSACIAALKFDFSEAFRLHPMFWSVPILALYVLFEGRLFKKKVYDIILLSAILAGFIIQYLLRHF